MHITFKHFRVDISPFYVLGISSGLPGFHTSPNGSRELLITLQRYWLVAGAARVPSSLTNNFVHTQSYFGRRGTKIMSTQSILIPSSPPGRTSYPTAMDARVPDPRSSAHNRLVSSYIPPELVDQIPDFDENDLLSDEEDLSFNDSHTVVIKNPQRSAAIQPQRPPPQHVARMQSFEGDDDCSVIGWSSSPYSHKVSTMQEKNVPGGAANFNRMQRIKGSGLSSMSTNVGQSTVTIDIPDNEINSIIQPNGSIMQLAGSKRTLPWENHSSSKSEVMSEGISNAAKKKVNSKVLNKNRYTDIIEVNTKMKATRTTTSTKRSGSRAASEAPEPQKRIAKIFLSEEQKLVIRLVCEERKSVFFTGSAGTGKSVLLREIISSLRRKHSRDNESVAITASTGLAACNVGGVTLHSFAGFGLGKEDLQTLVKRIRRNKKAMQRWLRTKVLIMDEISMVDGELFDKLEAIARQIRNRDSPFGGIQLVVTGDFFQLPPVPDYGKKASSFAFESNSWNIAIPETICLTQVFRQKDQTFVDMLNEMRIGKLSQASIEEFKKLDRIPIYDDNLEPTELFCTRQEVEMANSRRMSGLPGQEHTYDAFDSGTSDPAVRAKLLSSCMAPEQVVLKQDCQVMLIKNMDDVLVNGSLGKVIGFMNESVYAKYREDQFREQFGSGDTSDGDWEPNGKVGRKADVPYPDDDSLGITSLRERKNKREEEFVRAMADTSKKWPLVRFTLPDATIRDMLILTETWKIELPNGEIQAQRSQVPLILAWALSIHKAQGQTLERVKVDLGRVFEKGQAYVALSRATSKDGLQVLHFNATKVRVHEKVTKFYLSLTTFNQTRRDQDDEALLEAHG
ncbi:PIF1-like helicase-domain-containing protein [Lipomyces orientalis]|uniref:PIF1-like helicase-domain-containing protein n=1 Tax=Lipomyces orientalis TaxID=1233043 RepID=A0ACC3TRB3_9ASCO